MQGSPGSAPRVRTPPASCPQAAEPKQCLAANKTAQSCFEPLFLGTWGDLSPPRHKPSCLEERGDKGRGGQGTAEPARPRHPQEPLSLLASGQSCAQRREAVQLIHHAHGRGTSVPSPQAQLCSVVSSLGCQFFHRCPRGSATGQRPGSSCGGGLRGAPLCPARRRRRVAG